MFVPQSMAGVGYLFGTISPVVKGVLGYNQRQVAALGVAKNLEDCVGFLAGALSAMLPAWGLLLIGAAHSFLGYGWLWLVVSRHQAGAGATPLDDVCSSLCGNQLLNILQHGFTCYILTCIENFPKSRGPTVGILKAFSSLSSAILTQIYAVMHTPDHATLIFMVAVGPALVAIGLMFVIRPVGGHHQARPSVTAWLFCSPWFYSSLFYLLQYLWP